MTRRALRFLGGLVGVVATTLTTALVIGIGVIAWILASGPLPLDWLVPQLERSLGGRLEQFEVDIGHASLAWNRDDFGPELVLERFELLDSTGAPALVVPYTMLRLDGSAILHGEIAPRQVRLSGLSLMLVRRADGAIDVGLGDSTEAAGARPPLDTERLIAELSAGGGPAAALRSIVVERADVTLIDAATDQRLEARDGTLRLERGATGTVTGRLGFSLTQQGPVAHVKMSGRHTEGAGWSDLAVAFENVVPVTLAPLLPNVPLAPFDFPLSGHLGLPPGPTPRLWPMEVELSAERFILTWPEVLAQPVRVEQLTARGQLDGAARSARIDRLSLTSGGASIAMHGTAAGWGGPFTTDLTAEVKTLRASQVIAFWSVAMAPGAREWVAENLTGGTIPSGEVTVRLDRQQPGTPLPAAAITGVFAFEDVAVRFLESMPEARALRGLATVGGASLHFAVASGMIGDVSVKGGEVTIARADDGAALGVRAEVEATVPAALAVLDRPPLGVAKALQLEPGRTGGRMTGSVEIDLPLRAGIRPSDVRYRAQAQVRETALPDFLGSDLDLALVEAQFAVTPQGIDVDGKGRVNGVPFTLQGRDSFVARGGERRRFEAKGVLDAAAAAALGVTLPSRIDGKAPVQLTVVVPDKGPERYRLMADLAGISVAAGPYGWRKGAGEPASLTAEALLAEGRLEVTAFTVAAPALEARGSALASGRPLRLDRLTLDRLQVMGSELSGALRRDGEAYALQANARLLDLRPALREPWPEDGTGGELPELAVTLTADRLRLADDPISDLRASGRWRDGRWRDVKLTGRLTSGSPVEASIGDGGRALRVRSDDAGDLWRALSTGDSRITGGRLRLDATLGADRPLSGAVGELKLRGFTVERLPVLARIASLMSLTGLANALEGKGVPFELLEVPFRFDGWTARIEKARLVGSQLGLTGQGTVDFGSRRLDLDGTVVPAYTVNRILGEIPILGWLMRGQEAQGAFAATYSARGSFDAPEIVVNPLAALVPGFIRDLFANLGDDASRPAGRP